MGKQYLGIAALLGLYITANWLIYLSSGVSSRAFGFCLLLGIVATGYLGGKLCRAFGVKICEENLPMDIK